MRALAVIVLLTGCATPEAGCLSYGEARLSMPRGQPLTGPWGAWVADLDDRITGACR